jgi:hypothetical protein
MTQAPASGLRDGSSEPNANSVKLGGPPSFAGFQVTRESKGTRLPTSVPRKEPDIWVPSD